MAKKFKYYNVRETIAKYPDAHYFVVYGERSNGKTYSALDLAIENYIARGEQFAYVRRYGEDIRRKHMSELFSGHIANNRISQLSKGEWDTVVYATGRFYLAKTNEDGEVIRDENPFGFTFDLNSMEHYKSTSFPNITLIIFDEFLSRTGYLANEFILFQNTISTIVRLRTNVKILMLGNTVNKYCPYFTEMGLVHIKDQKPGTIDVYTYGDTKLKVVVEYCESSAKRGGKESNVYFAFDNPQLQMITSGEWEISVYPHCPVKYRPKDVISNCFFLFDGELLHGELVCVDTGMFLFIHRKTTPVKNIDNDVVYTDVPSERYNYKMCMTHHTDKLTKLILKLFREGNVFYADNEIGEIIRNYVIWCENYSVAN